MGLEEHPFDWHVTKDGRVLVSRGGRRIAVVAGGKAIKLSAVLESGDEDAAQHALAGATSNYRHGNERAPERP